MTPGWMSEIAVSHQSAISVVARSSFVMWSPLFVVAWTAGRRSQLPSAEARGSSTHPAGGSVQWLSDVDLSHHRVSVGGSGAAKATAAHLLLKVRRGSLRRTRAADRHPVVAQVNIGEPLN